MASMTRPTWWSVCSRNPAYTSIWRSSTGLSSSGMSSHAGMTSWRAVSSASWGTTPSSFWRAIVSSRTASQPWRELPRVLVGPLLRHVVRRMGGAGREVHEERLVGHQRLLLAHPAHAVVGEVLGEVVPLLGGRGRLDRGRAVVQRRVPLVVLAADEAVEALEPSAAGRPRVERAHRRGLPHRDLVALAELCRRVPVQLQRHGQRRLRVRPQRAVPGGRRGGLGDRSHPDRVVVAAGEQGLSGRRAQRRGVEAVEPEAAGGEALRRGRPARPTEGARCTEADVVDQDDEDVRRSLRWEQRLDRRVRRIRILGVVGHQARGRPVGDGQHRPCVPVR